MANDHGDGLDIGVTNGNKIWESWNEMRKKTILCDVELVSADDCVFPVHKAILAANSQCFYEEFTQETSIKGKEVKISILSDDLEVILDYMYTRDAKVTWENIWRVYDYGVKYIMTGLLEYCRIFIRAGINCENCIKIFWFSEKAGETEIFDSCRKFILHNYPNVAKSSDDFVNLNFNDIHSFVSDKFLDAKLEEAIFESVIRWIEHDVSARRHFLSSFLASIRLGLIDFDYFSHHVSCNPHVLAEKETCEYYIAKAWNYLLELQQHRNFDDITLENPLVQPRVPSEVVFVLGGWCGDKAVAQFETYDTRADRWFSHTELKEKSVRSYHGMAVVNNRIYVIGGFDGKNDLNTTRRFDPVTKIWTDTAPMYIQRSFVSVTVCLGLIYAMGGRESPNDVASRQRLKSVERYDPATNQWSMVKDMLESRSDAGADTLDGKIYIAGGYNGLFDLSSVEQYNPLHDQWTSIQPMTVPRGGLSAITHEGYFYVFGGFDGENRLGTAEKYDPMTKKWTSIANMYTPRSNCACAVIDDLILLMGGFNGESTIEQVECYDPVHNEWLDATFMNLHRSACKAGVIKDIPNVTDYTYYGCNEDKYYIDWQKNENE